MATAPPFSPDTAFHQGLVALASGDRNSAIGWFRKVVAVEPTHACAHYSLGRALRDGGEDGGSARRRAFLINPAALPHANHALGLVFEEQGRMGDAVVCQMQALAQTADHAPGRDPIAIALLRAGWRVIAGTEPIPWADLGHTAFRLGEDGLALAAFRRAARDIPDAPAPRRWIADTLYRLGRADRNAETWKQADAILRIATALAPSDPAVWSSIGHVRFARGREEKALAAFRRLLRLDPSHDHAACWAGDTAFALHRTAEAENLYRRAVILTPDTPAVWSGLGHGLFRRMAFAAAAAAFARAWTLAPNDETLSAPLTQAIYRALNTRMQTYGCAIAVSCPG